MAKLPPTSYLRLVDIWLITTQLVPFLLVVLITSIGLYENDAEINHHGFTRYFISLECLSKQVFRKVKSAFEDPDEMKVKCIK